MGRTKLLIVLGLMSFASGSFAKTPHLVFTGHQAIIGAEVRVDSTGLPLVFVQTEKTEKAACEAWKKAQTAEFEKARLEFFSGRLRVNETCGVISSNKLSYTSWEFSSPVQTNEKVKELLKQNVIPIELRGIVYGRLFETESKYLWDRIRQKKQLVEEYVVKVVPAFIIREYAQRFTNYRRAYEEIRRVDLTSLEIEDYADYIDLWSAFAKIYSEYQASAESFYEESRLDDQDILNVVLLSHKRPAARAYFANTVLPFLSEASSFDRNVKNSTLALFADDISKHLDEFRHGAVVYQVLKQKADLAIAQLMSLQLAALMGVSTIEP